MSKLSDLCLLLILILIYYDRYKHEPRFIHCGCWLPHVRQRYLPMKTVYSKHPFTFKRPWRLHGGPVVRCDYANTDIQHDTS